MALCASMGPRTASPSAQTFFQRGGTVVVHRDHAPVVPVSRPQPSASRPSVCRPSADRHNHPLKGTGLGAVFVFPTHLDFVLGGRHTGPPCSPTGYPAPDRTASAAPAAPYPDPERAKKSSSASRMVTSAPSLDQALPNSRPMAPAPITASFFRHPIHLERKRVESITRSPKGATGIFHRHRARCQHNVIGGDFRPCRPPANLPGPTSCALP